MPKEPTDNMKWLASKFLEDLGDRKIRKFTSHKRWRQDAYWDCPFCGALAGNGTDGPCYDCRATGKQKRAKYERIRKVAVILGG